MIRRSPDVGECRQLLDSLLLGVLDLFFVAFFGGGAGFSPLALALWRFVLPAPCVLRLLLLPAPALVPALGSFLLALAHRWSRSQTRRCQNPALPIIKSSTSNTVRRKKRKKTRRKKKNIRDNGAFCGAGAGAGILCALRLYIGLGADSSTSLADSLLSESARCRSKH